MLPLTLLAAQKVSDLLTTDNALQQVIAAMETQFGVNLPQLSPGQIVLSSASADIADKDVQLTYPRVCIYSAQVKNTQVEKFRSFSGTVAVAAEVWSSANLVQDTDQCLHYYLEAVTSILRANLGDWGDGVFFSGAYDVQLQAPKAGGFGYVESAKITCNLNVSFN